MENYNYKKNIDINECTSRGFCSVSPTIVSLEELAISFLRQISYYLLKLEDFGANNEKIRLEILNVLASLVLVNEFSEQQLFEIVQKEYYMLAEVKKTYVNMCRKVDLKPENIKTLSKFKQSTSIAQAIAFGEKLFLDNLKKYSSELKNMRELLLIVLKSISLNIINLADYSFFEKKYFNEIVSALNILNVVDINHSKIVEMINNLVELDKFLQLKIYEFLFNTFNGISKVEVSRSSTKGKAILVSGNNFCDLYKILEETQNKDIDVYTHSNLLIAHALNSFRKFKNLKGHYGDTTENCILDFATFPGSILLTKSSHSNNEYLYRGRLFSNDYILPKGVIKIQDNDFNPVIDAALYAKGFSKGKVKDSIVVGFDLKEVLSAFENIVQKIESGEIERLYIIGLDSHSEIQKEYFNKFFSKLNNKEYVISFSYSSENENVYTVNVANYLPLVVGLLKYLFEHISIDASNVYFFFTKCDVMSISNIITIKNSGAKNVYLYKCSPNEINPSLLKGLSSIFKLNFYSNVIEDLNKIRNI